MKHLLSTPPNSEVIVEPTFPFQSNCLLQRLLKDIAKSKDMQSPFLSQWICCCNNSNLWACCRTKCPICYAYSRRSGWLNSSEDNNDAIWSLACLQPRYHYRATQRIAVAAIWWTRWSPAKHSCFHCFSQMSRAPASFRFLSLHFNESEPCAFASFMREYVSNCSLLEDSVEELSSGHLDVITWSCYSILLHWEGTASNTKEGRENVDCNWGLCDIATVLKQPSMKTSPLLNSLADLSGLSK